MDPQTELQHRETEQDLESQARANAALIAVSLSLTLFWVLNIVKEGNASFKAWLTLLPPVGPLSGLFALATACFILVWVLTRLTHRQSSPRASSFSISLFVIATLLFFFMTFPPILSLFV